MLYYQGYSISFQEVPDEITLVILIADCPYRCPGCHSPDLQEAKGKDLEKDILSIIDEYSDAITCVCLMGDGQDRRAVIRCAKIIKSLGFKSALYTGKNESDAIVYLEDFDYLKYGPYVESLGGLDSEDTNQHMLKVTKRFDRTGVSFEDITYKFKHNYE